MVPRMRTIDQCVAYFKEQDPETIMTRYRIRTLIKEGTIPHVMCGQKYVVNLDKLIEYLSGPAPGPEKKPEPKRVKIRRLVV